MLPAPNIARHSGPLPDEFVWAPAGVFVLGCFKEVGYALEPGEHAVRVDEFGSVACELDRLRRAIAGKFVPLDHEHNIAAPATGFVTRFDWDPARGIVAKVEWTAAGEELLRSGVARKFSPSCQIDPATRRIVGLGKHSAGGLVAETGFGRHATTIVPDVPEE